MQRISTVFSFPDLEIKILRKKVKHLRITVSPPHGTVKVLAPLAVSDNSIHEFIFAQLNWIRKYQKKFQSQIKQARINYDSGEQHFFMGKLFQLSIIEIKSTAYNEVKMNKQTITLFVKPHTSSDKREKLLYEWYRSEIKKIIPTLINKWEPIIGESVSQWRIRKMKTRWGSCNIKVKRIWLNLELVKKSPECIEYVLVHEMVHLLERYHNKKFYQYMDQFLPHWKVYRKQLNNMN